MGLLSSVGFLFILNIAVIQAHYTGPLDHNHIRHPNRHRLIFAEKFAAKNFQTGDHRRRKEAAGEKCDKCLPGWGLVQSCNGTHKTVCQPCPVGTWTPKRPHIRHCSPCSQCGDGLYEQRKCTETSDTRCGGCENQRGLRSDDFYLKCLKTIEREERKAATRKFLEEKWRNSKYLAPIISQGDTNPEHQFWQLQGIDKFGDMIQRQSQDRASSLIDFKPSHAYHIKEIEKFGNSKPETSKSLPNRKIKTFNHHQKNRKFLPSLRHGNLVHSERKVSFLIYFCMAAVGALLCFTMWIVYLCHCNDRQSQSMVSASRIYERLTPEHNEYIQKCVSELRNKGKLRNEETESILGSKNGEDFDCDFDNFYENYQETDNNMTSVSYTEQREDAPIRLIENPLENVENCQKNVKNS